MKEQCFSIPIEFSPEFILTSCCRCVAGACFCGKSSGKKDCRCAQDCGIGLKLQSYADGSAKVPFFLSRSIQVHGRILDFKRREDTISLNKFRVVVALPHGSLHEAFTDEEGRFELHVNAYDCTSMARQTETDIIELGDCLFDADDEQGHYFLAIVPK